MAELPKYAHFTNEALGEGLFDQLMAAARKHILEEYTEGHITSDSYSRVLLGVMEACLTSTTQYLLGLVLMDEQADKIEKETQLIQTQTDKLEYEIEFLLPAQLAQIEAETDRIRAEIIKINAEKLLIDAQTLLTGKQGEKIDKEIEFMDAKIKTEKSNTEAGIADLDSVVGRQINLLRIQGLGFAGELEAKAAKLHSDYDGLFQTTQETTTASSLSLNSINAIIGMLETVEKMKDDAFTDPVFENPVAWVPPEYGI